MEDCLNASDDPYGYKALCIRSLLLIPVSRRRLKRFTGHFLTTKSKSQADHQYIIRLHLAAFPLFSFLSE